MDSTVYEVLERKVKYVRRYLEKKYYADAGREDDNFAGLCIEATKLFMNKIKSSCEHSEIPIKVKEIHGEQKHCPRLQSKYWCFQHDWCCVEIAGVRYYIDCTCGQFKRLYDDIPDYYISTKKPKWFLPDRENMAFNGVTKEINKRIIIHRKITDSEGKKRVVSDGLIEFLQYEIWGRISDFIRKILRYEDKNW